MIVKYDLYDISAAFTRIRHDIHYPLNIEILNRIIAVLDESFPCSGENQIRKAISTIKDLDEELWYFVYTNNVYVNHALVKNQAIYDILIKSCKAIKESIEEEKFEKAYDLVDAVHCLPDIIADNHFKITESYWEIYIKPYRIKWDKRFLMKEQKSIIILLNYFYKGIEIKITA
ncbi:MAG: hypothetical protein GX638_13525 [Crenarchaeota archaeon]|nr:hypothetical protein [Thermoproteota archaeon]